MADFISQKTLTISIVSHGQLTLAMKLLADIRNYCKDIVLELILTLNIPEKLPFSELEYPFPIKIIRNPSPLGFGENHNQAFRQARGDYFCLLNPDIRIDQNVFVPLISQLEKTPRLGLIAPLVLDPRGNPEDSARDFPTPSEIVAKCFGGKSKRHEGSPTGLSNPDWVAGMFMLLPSRAYRDIGGFDASYFLYYEDVDLCARLTLKNYLIGFYPGVSITHDARRNSHHNLRYQRMHLQSMFRFFASSVYREIRMRCKQEKDRSKIAQ